LKPKPRSDQEQSVIGSTQEGFLEITDFPHGAAKNRYASHFVNVDRRTPSNTVFHIDDNTFTSAMPRGTHWSIAWSDLMMTMFVLFLVMFVYQTANQEFLVKQKSEVIGGDTTEALQTLDSSGASFPFAPISPGLPLITGGTVKKVKKVEIEAIDPSEVYPIEISREANQQLPVEKEQSTPSPTASGEPLRTDPVDVSEPEVPSQGATSSDPTVALTSGPPLAPEEKTESPEPDQFQEIYTMSKGALKTNNLDKFAAIDIIPDKTMRIILTGDLFFALGESQLSEHAKASLRQIVTVIQQTPYMINVVGHTDNLPMRSKQFMSNWELSVARASSVARFLIDEMGMNPVQFVVSGYASYRPIAPNTTAENRAKNRRVEIIISKRLPNPLPATVENLQ
jgi:chemotaxis protein MotB